MAWNYGGTSRDRSLSTSSASSYQSLSDKGSSLTSEILPIGQYNSKKAKLCASIRWLVSKAYSSSNIPPDIRNPFFKDKQGEDHLRPAVIYQLSSGELYSRACANIFPPSPHQWQGHWSVIQGLSRRGIYVVDDKRQPVTEAVLMQTQRIKLNAHLAVMDSIMTAYTGEVVSIEKIVQAIRCITTFNASSELPFDLENALVFWVNKVCVAVKHRMELERRGQQEQLMQSQPQKVRIRRQQLQALDLPRVPVLKNVTKDVSDGRSLCLLIHYYCPHLFSLEDVDLHDTMSFADSVNNLQQVEHFLEQHLSETHHFTFEDLLYSPEILRVNILALIAELFHWFEVAKPPHLGFTQELGQKIAVSSESGKSRVQQLPPIPISSATKKSFHGDAPSRSELRSAASNPEVNRITSSSPQRSQSLLQRERKPRNALHADESQANLRRASSLEDLEARQSFLAWQSREDARNRSQTLEMYNSGDSQDLPVRDSNASNLLANVSIDSDVHDSQNFSELNSLHNLNGCSSLEGKHGPLSLSSQFENEDDLEVESLTSALSRVSQREERIVLQSGNDDRSSRNENGYSTDQELTNVTPMSSISSKPTDSFSSATIQIGQPDVRSTLSDQKYDRNNQPNQSRTNGNGGFSLSDSVEPEIQMMTVTQPRRRLKLDIQPVETKQTEKLLPAVVRPLKEKSQNVNKKEESGEVRRASRNPREDRSGRPPNSVSGMTTWSRKRGSTEDGESPESLDAITPLSGESIADSLAGDVAHHRMAWQKPTHVALHQTDPTSDTNPHFGQQDLHVAHAKQGEAFFIHTDAQSEKSLGSSSLSRTGTGSSFTIVDKKYTADSAREAGIPVVSSRFDVQEAAEGDQSSSSSRANPRHPSAYPNLHAAPSHHNPVSAWYPTEHPSGNPRPNPSPNPHALSNSPLHGNARNPNALHSGGDGPGRTHVDTPSVGHSNTGMARNSNLPHPHPSSPDKESFKLHADQIQRESSPELRKPVLMMFNSNLSPDKKPTVQQFIIPTTSSQVTHSESVNPDQEPNPSSLDSESPITDSVPPKDPKPTDVISIHNPDISPDRSLLTHPKADLDLSRQPITVEQSCIPLDSASSDPQSQVLTTWSANPKQTPLCGIINTGGGHPNPSSNPTVGDLAQIRTRLEEKRRLMDTDKRKLERQWSKQRQRMGKAAFLQVLANQKRTKDGTSEDRSIRAEDDRLAEKQRTRGGYSKEEIERSIEQSQTQWSSNRAQQEGKITFAALGSSKEKYVSNREAESPRQQKTPTPHQPVESASRRADSPQGIPEATTGKSSSPGSSSGSHSPHMTSEEYNTSLEKLNANLSQLQSEIQRLSLRQEQMRSAMESPRPPSEQSRSPTQALPSNSKPFVLHSTGNKVAEPQGFFLTADTDKEQGAFVLHENPIYDLPVAEVPAGVQSPRPVGPVQKLPPEVGQGSISRSFEQPQALQTAYPANQVPPHPPDSTFIIPPSTPTKNQNVEEVPKKELPQNLTKVLSLSTANGHPRNAELLANQHQPPLPTVASLSSEMAQISDDNKSPPDVPGTGDDLKKAKTNQIEATSPMRKKQSSVYEIVGEGNESSDSEEERMVVRPLDSTGNTSLDVSADSKAKTKGFVVASETDQLDEVEKRKMLFLQNRLKKQEEEKAKRASREAEMEKKREQNRRRQEELEAKKAEEKARREQIRLDYQRRKLQDQQENEPSPVRRVKSTKPRPKSHVTDDQTGFGHPTSSRYDRDPDECSTQKKPFAVIAPSVGDNAPKAPSMDGHVPAGAVGGGTSEKVEPTSSPKQQPVPSTTSEGAANNNAPKRPKSEKKPSEKAPESVSNNHQPVPQSPKRPAATTSMPLKHDTQQGQEEEVAGGSCAVSVVSQDSGSGGGNATTADYQGPKLYVKPTSKSNRHIITNAISHCVLAGSVNKEHKDKVLEELAKAEAKHFIVLFRDAQLQFRALYGYSPDSEELTKLYGVGPRHITHKMYENLYKYNSGSKQFSKIPSKTMSVSVDGLTIGTSYWLSKKGPKKH